MQTDNPTINKGTCLFCGDPTPDMVCPECEAKNEAKNAEMKAQEEARIMQAREDRFREAVGHYADTVKDLLPDTAARRAASQYIIGSGAGLTIIGAGDNGKTRSAVWVALRELRAGSWVEFRQCGEMRQEVAQFARNGEYGKGISPLMRCDVLVLDDFGNHDFTRTFEEFFLHLVERRTKLGKRIFLTSQYTSDQMKALFSTPQMADAAIRRIGIGFATIVNTFDNSIKPWK